MVGNDLNIGGMASHSESDIGSRFKMQLRDWYAERTKRRHIESGNANYNYPQEPPESDVFRPNRLLQCRRKQFYRERNAPSETPAPKGIFYTGSKLEEELILPYLREQVDSWDDRLFVANSLWIEEELQVADKEVTIRGSTDPVVVQADGTPVFVTEVKSKESLGDSTSASRHHLAQLHAYMAGLSAAHNRQVKEGAILYVSRKNLELTLIPVMFDNEFWTEVGEWMQHHARDREDDLLPPADPKYDWECGYCAFAARCGKRADSSVADAGPRGFVPNVEYPSDAVENHIEAYPDVGLTATIGDQYPKLTEDHEITVPFCPTCGETVTSTPDRPEDPSNPLCATCAKAGDISELKMSLSDRAE